MPDHHHELSGESLFIAGTVWNQARFRSRFDQPLLRSSATVEIDTRQPFADVVDRLAVLAGPRTTAH
ncbi:MAG TPA: hypothetical protein VHV49_13995 [Pseudonocardiaceae bacterium]|nr:hypothetical protein [Pseudonocardiaceae bacterium]